MESKAPPLPGHVPVYAIRSDALRINDKSDLKHSNSEVPTWASPLAHSWELLTFCFPDDNSFARLPPLIIKDTSVCSRRLRQYEREDPK